jgi:hypothetical protein
MLTEGRVTLDDMVRELSNLPDEVVAPLHARSVLVTYQGGWANHCTQLRIGPFEDEYAALTDRTIGSVRLVAAQVGALNRPSVAGLTEALAAWSRILPRNQSPENAHFRLGTAVIPTVADFQQATNVFHHSSRNPYGQLPAWVMELRDNSGWQSNVDIPRAQYNDTVTGIFRESIGALTEMWLHDSTLREANNFLNSYKIVIPDGRGIVSAEKVGHRRLRFAVSGSASGPLTLAAVIRPAVSPVERKKWSVKPGDLVDLELPPAVVRVEASLLDDDSGWLDQVSLTEQQLDSARAGDGLEAKLSAPRYAAVLQSYQKSVGFAFGQERDLHNATKEAISALESIAKIVSGHHSDSLGQALKHLSESKRLDPALSKAVQALWGYASRKPFVRHGGVRPEDIEEGEARFVLDVSTGAIELLLSLDR